MQHRHAAIWKANCDSTTQSISFNLSANNSQSPVFLIITKVIPSTSSLGNTDGTVFTSLPAQSPLCFSLPFRHLTAFIHTTAVMWYRLEAKKALSCYLRVSMSSIHFSKRIPYKGTYPCLQGLQNSDTNLQATLVTHTLKPKNRQHYCELPKYSGTGSKHCRHR